MKFIFSSQDLGIQSTSTLHCVRGNFAANVEMQRSTRPIKVGLGNVQPTASAGMYGLLEAMKFVFIFGVYILESQETHFYVFCKKPCGAMAPGKLRVRCYNCKNSSFVLDRVCVSICFGYLYLSYVLL